MKVSITLNNPYTLTGYLNLDPIVEPGSIKVKVDVANLDEYLDVGECQEILSCDVLNYYESGKVDEIIDNWIDKLRKGGIIQFSEVDIESVLLSLQRGEINLDKLNTLLFGEQKRKWDFKKCGLSSYVMCNKLISKNLEIIEKTYHGYNFFIKARKR
jgi:hypothetical protein